MAHNVLQKIKNARAVQIALQGWLEREGLADSQLLEMATDHKMREMALDMMEGGRTISRKDEDI